MFRKNLLITAISGVLMFTGSMALAADQARDRDRLHDPEKSMDQSRDQDRDQLRDQDKVYGSQLMTAQEQKEYRQRMQAAKTAEEREQIRNEHHKQMQARAKERGVTLPDEPPERGSGMMRRDDSMRPGGGMGSGGGKR